MKIERIGFIYIFIFLKLIMGKMHAYFINKIELEP